MAVAPSYSETVRQNQFVEPLGGPIPVNRLLEIFPDEVYDKSPSSHFYKFMYAMFGQAGIGSMTKSYFQARLKMLEYGIEFFDLEKFYEDPFKFSRILEETIFYDVEGTLLPENWETVIAQDNSYRSRAIDFLHAVRLGGTPEGMRMAAKSGLGHDVEIFERYKWIFDQFSDQPIGIKSWGHTLSTSEFTIVPRKEAGISEIQQIRFQVETDSGTFALVFEGHQTPFMPIRKEDESFVNAFDIQQALRALPNIGSSGVEVTGGPAPLPFNVKFTGPLQDEDVAQIEILSALTISVESGYIPANAEIVTLLDGYSPPNEINKISERLAHNAQSAIDRLRPIDSLPTYNVARSRVVQREWNFENSLATSTFNEPVRFVTGLSSVNWPTAEVDEKYWIEAGVEKPAKKMHGGNSAHYVNFHAALDARSYIFEATESPDYETDFPSPNFFSYGVVNEINALPIKALDPSPDSKVIFGDMVQGVYPNDYSALPNVRSIPSENIFWQSFEREAPLAECLEIDLGKTQIVNYIDFDFFENNIIVNIDYDILDRSPMRRFKPVKPTQQYGTQFYRDPTQTSKWKNFQYQFTDQNDDLIATRFVRITFTRFSEFDSSDKYPILVRGMKVGRNVL